MWQQQGKNPVIIGGLWEGIVSKSLWVYWKAFTKTLGVMNK